MLELHEQATLREVGKEGCYLLCVKRIAEIELQKELNPVQVYRDGVAMGRVRSDCLLLDAGKLLSDLTGETWEKFNIIAGNPMPAGIVYLVAEYAKKTPSATLTHFVLMQNDGVTILYNPLPSDWLVNGWSIVEYRAFIRGV